MHCNNNDQCSFCMVEREEYEYNSKGYVKKNDGMKNIIKNDNTLVFYFCLNIECMERL